MAKYDVTVDTRDMANKIDTVSNKVSGVTTAVVAMEAAVIAAERDATNKLCKRLNKGFFSLVTSQIEQKNATALSSVNAYASELIQQQEALLDLKKRMGDDFVILTERYSKLFRGLDVALHNRVHELDKPVIRFCEWDVAITLNRLNNLIEHGQDAERHGWNRGADECRPGFLRGAFHNGAYAPQLHDGHQRQSDRTQHGRRLRNMVVEHFLFRPGHLRRRVACRLRNLYGQFDRREVELQGHRRTCRIPVPHVRHEHREKAPRQQHLQGAAGPVCEP